MPPQVEQCAYQHGAMPDSYLVTEPDYQQFWNRRQTGMIGYLRDRHYLHLMGGLICPPEDREELLREFCEFVDEHRLLPSFFSIPECDVELFASYGYQVTKFGEDARLKLPRHSWQGKSYSWVRRQVSYVTRQGYVAREIQLDDLSDEERHQAFEHLQEMNEEQLSHRVLKHEIELLEGRLIPDAFYRRRLFIAHPADEPDNW
ncbi:MAG: DUF2156 domain-containing protein, partial [Planctomycetaceae bacterium]|nr:DUF2156 domain-containing protein [Planctomycetaceae bacterium]